MSNGPLASGGPFGAAWSMEPRTPPASDRLQLEVDVIRVGDAPLPTQPDESLGQLGHRVLVLMSNPDLREYVRHCFRDVSDLRVFAPHDAAETRSDALTRVSPDLLIADASPATGSADELRHSTVPLLLIGDATPELVAANLCSPNRAIELLPVPFNSRRLLDAVERLRLLGRAGTVPDEP